MKWRMFRQPENPRDISEIKHLIFLAAMYCIDTENISGEDMKKYIICYIISGLLISAVPAMSSDGFVGDGIALGDDTCMN